MAPTTLVPAPVSAPAPASLPTVTPSASSEQNSQNVPAIQTSTPSVSLNHLAPKDMLPSIPAASDATPVPEPSTEPHSSNRPPIATLNDTPTPQTTSNIASTSKGPQNSAPAKGSRKAATKKAPKPKKMAPAKLVSDPVLFVPLY